MARKAISEAEIREALLREATAAFLRDGIVATEMKAVAAAAGLSRSTLYRYAISKNRLVFLVGARQLRLLVDEARERPLPQSAAGWERLRHFCLSLIDVLASRPDILRMMSEFDAIYTGPYPDIPEARDYVVAMRGLREIFLRMVRDGLEDGSIAGVPDPRLFTAALANAIYGLAARFFPREAHYLEEDSFGGRAIITEIVSRLLDGVRA
ncbi:MAG: TetR/AcrR family transcriptional regulator [Clostridia bacterium]|nr:TetR/AcrR family transcriptional regulator [Clostridia bacterium]